MIYDIRHVTTYAYESAVSFARCTLRLEPKDGNGQKLISHSVDIRPRPAERNVRRDFFGTLRRVGRLALGHGQSVRGEDLLRLVFVQLHEGQYKAAPVRGRLVNQAQKWSAS